MWIKKQSGELVSTYKAEYIEVRSYGEGETTKWEIIIVFHRVSQFKKGGVLHHSEIFKRLYKSSDEEDCRKMLSRISAAFQTGQNFFAIPTKSTNE